MHGQLTLAKPVTSFYNDLKQFSMLHLIKKALKYAGIDLKVGKNQV
jgi:hypothetical protein